MPRTATPGAIAQPRPSLTLVRGSRGVPEQVQIRRTDALAPCLEGIAACDAAIAAAQRITIALANGSSYAVQHEANRLRKQADACRAELRRMAGAIDGGQAA